MDRHTKEQRRKNMQAIRGKDTKPEMIVRKYLFAHGFRYRLHDRRLPGTPDIVLPRYRCVVFVHGCFWHGHDCPAFHWPRTNAGFWREKINRNKERDAAVEEALKGLGWRVETVWECDLHGERCEQTLCELEQRLRKLLLVGEDNSENRIGEKTVTPRVFENSGRDPAQPSQ